MLCNTASIDICMDAMQSQYSFNRLCAVLALYSFSYHSNSNSIYHIVSLTATKSYLYRKSTIEYHFIPPALPNSLTELSIENRLSFAKVRFSITENHLLLMAENLIYFVKTKKLSKNVCEPETNVSKSIIITL